MSAYQTATKPQTNSDAAIVLKNTTKEELIANARELGREIQGTPTVTDFQKAELGLTVRDTEPTPIAPPSADPIIIIESAVGRTVTIRLKDKLNPDNRGRPDGVDGATVMSFVGTIPPDPGDKDAWTFQGNIGRTRTSITFPPTVPSGATAWFTAFWFNPRKQSGPAAAPISAQIPGTMQQAA